MNLIEEKVKDVAVAGDMLTVYLEGSRVISNPLTLYPSLAEASVKERANWEPCGAGTGIYWPDLDYDLSIDGILRGAKELPSVFEYVQNFKEQKLAM